MHLERLEAELAPPSDEPALTIFLGPDDGGIFTKAAGPAARQQEAAGCDDPRRPSATPKGGEVNGCCAATLLVYSPNVSEDILPRLYWPAAKARLPNA